MRHGGWNQESKHKVKDRVIWIRISSTANFNKTHGCWEVMSGTIHQVVPSLHGKSTKKMTARFEARFYHPYESVGVELKPVNGKALSHISHFHAGSFPGLDAWLAEVRENVAQLYREVQHDFLEEVKDSE